MPYTTGGYTGNHQQYCLGRYPAPVGVPARYLSVYSTHGPTVYTPRCVSPAVLTAVPKSVAVFLGFLCKVSRLPLFIFSRNPRP